MHTTRKRESRKHNWSQMAANASDAVCLVPQGDEMFQARCIEASRQCHGGEFSATRVSTCAHGGYRLSDRPLRRLAAFAGWALRGPEKMRACCA